MGGRADKVTCECTDPGFVRDVSMMRAVKRTGLKTLVLNLTQNVDARSGAAV